MSELVKNSADDFIRVSARKNSSAFLDGLTKMSTGGATCAAAAAVSDTPVLIHSLSLMISLMMSLCSLARFV